MLRYLSRRDGPLAGYLMEMAIKETGAELKAQLLFQLGHIRGIIRLIE